MLCNSCNKEVEPKSRGFIFFLFWPWTIIFMKKNVLNVEKMFDRIIKGIIGIISIYF